MRGLWGSLGEEPFFEQRVILVEAFLRRYLKRAMAQDPIAATATHLFVHTVCDFVHRDGEELGPSSRLELDCKRLHPRLHFEFARDGGLRTGNEDFIGHFALPTTHAG